MMDIVTEKRLKRKLKKISNDLNKLLIEIKEHYPEANYMIDSGIIQVIPVEYVGGEKYSEHGSIMESDIIHDLDCGMWN